jgi:hypothetical protein
MSGMAQVSGVGLSSGGASQVGPSARAELPHMLSRGFRVRVSALPATRRSGQTIDKAWSKGSCDLSDLYRLSKRREAVVVDQAGGCPVILKCHGLVPSGDGEGLLHASAEVVSAESRSLAMGCAFRDSRTAVSTLPSPHDCCVVARTMPSLVTQSTLLASVNPGTMSRIWHSSPRIVREALPATALPASCGILGMIAHGGRDHPSRRVPSRARE